MDRLRPGRRGFATSAIALLASGSLMPPLRAQPPVPISRIICGYPPGGVADLISRTLAERLAVRYGDPVFVDNKPGAAGRIGVEDLRRGPRDGSVVLLTPASIVTLYSHVYRKLSYDPLTDLEPVVTVSNTAFALAIGPQVPQTVVTVAQFVHWCHSNSQEVTCGNAGAGSMQHLLATLVAHQLGISPVHVPFKGGPAAMQAAAAGEISAAFAVENSARPLHTAGKLRVIGTTTARRSMLFPESPTFHEMGWPELVQREWFGIFMPSSVPESTVRASARVIQEVTEESAVRDIWQRAGLAAESMPPDQLANAIRQESAFLKRLVNAAGFTPES